MIIYKELLETAKKATPVTGKDNGQKVINFNNELREVIMNSDRDNQSMQVSKTKIGSATQMKSEFKSGKQDPVSMHFLEKRQ